MNVLIKNCQRRKISVWLLVFLIALFTLTLPIHANSFMNDPRDVVSDVSEDMVGPMEDLADGASEMVEDMKDKAEDGIAEDSDGIIEDDSDKENKKGGWIALAVAALVVIGTVVVIIAVFPKKRS